MPKEKLRATLRELHDELKMTPALDDEARSLLQGAAADIDRLLHTDEQAAASHVGTLTDLATRFERDHPTLAAAIRQVADALANVGL